MSYDETMEMGGDQQRPQPVDDERPTEVMGPGGTPQYPPPPTEAPQQPQYPRPQQPMGGYGPPAPGAAKTEMIHKPPAALAWLAVKSGPRAGHLYRLAPDVTAIGRDSHNDIIVDDSSVSRQHAKVKLEQDDKGQKQFFVYDLATSNGTIVNGKQIVKEALYDGDEVEIGRTALVFKQIDGPTREGETAPSEEEAGEQEGE